MSKRTVSRGDVRKNGSASCERELDEDTRLIVNEDVGVVKFYRKHAQFWKDFRLSFFVGIWMMVFGAFSYSEHLRDFLFGDETVCKEEDLGLLSKQGVQTWCGWLPKAYATRWSNLVMMIIFTVHRNTGTTIMFAWQGVAGTAVAVANMWFMQLLFGECAENIIVWLDIIFFYFVVLYSGAAMNTMMFALNWHSYFMMEYLNPNKGEPSEFPMFIPYLDWDSSHMTGLATSIGGALLAIIATIIPVPITLTATVQDDATILVKGGDKIWTAAIEYMCGAEPSTKQDQIAEAVNAWLSTALQVQGNLADSWWENFDMCGAARRRLLYEHLDDTGRKLNDVMVVMAHSLCGASFTNKSREFLGSLREEMHELRRLGVSVLTVAVEGAADGDIDDQEHARLEEISIQLLGAQEKLLNKYLHLAGEDIRGAPSCSKDLIPELTFLFALSAWADEVHALAADARNLDRDLDEHHSALKDLGRLSVAGFRNTFGIPERSKLRFAVRNVVSIGGSFIAAKACGGRGLIFPIYSATMPATLSVLIHHHSGGAIVKNLKRLLAVLLGKVGPLVILSIFHVAASYSGISRCGTWQRDIVIALNILFLTWFATYVYFTSPQFSGVGCLMAAYGIGVLSGQCGSNKERDLIDRYKEVAQIVCAIAISTFVDVVFEMAFTSYPRDQAVGDVDEMNKAFRKSYIAYFKGDMKEVSEQLTAYKRSLGDARSMTGAADPDNEFCGSYRTPFRIDVYKDSLGTYEALKAEMSVLIMATEGRPRKGDKETQYPDSLFSYIHGIGSIGSLQQEFVQEAEIVMQSLKNFLAHGTEDNNFQDVEATNNLFRVSGKHSLDSLDRAIDDLNRHPLPAAANKVSAMFDDLRVRVTVAMASFHRSKVRFSEVDKMLLKRIML